MRTPEEVETITKAEKSARLNAVQDVAMRVLGIMAIGVEEQGFDDEEETKRLEDNKQLLKRLIAMARELGRDFSNVTR